MKIEIKSTSGNVLFIHECEDDNFKKTVIEAVEKSIDLRNADLGNADLRYADLGNADLRNADLRYADLRGANLGNADLRGADLRNADLRNADLGNADLRGANLSGADLSRMNGFNFSQCSFSAHGECGRVLTGIKIDGEVVFFCGCFKGSEKDLRDYIENGKEKHKESRLFALEFVLKSINM